MLAAEGGEARPCCQLGVTLRPKQRTRSYTGCMPQESMLRQPHHARVRARRTGMAQARGTSSRARVRARLCTAKSVGRSSGRPMPRISRRAACEPARGSGGGGRPALRTRQLACALRRCGGVVLPQSSCHGCPVEQPEAALPHRAARAPRPTECRSGRQPAGHAGARPM